MLTTPVARDDTAYAQIYSLYYVPMPPGVGAPDVGPPAVDFATETVVAVFVGFRPSAGYSVRVTDVVPEGDGVRVTVEETQPGPNCVVATVITQPFVMVAISKFSGSVAFDFKTVTQNCP